MEKNISYGGMVKVLQEIYFKFIQLYDVTDGLSAEAAYLPKNVRRTRKKYRKIPNLQIFKLSNDYVRTLP